MNLREQVTESVQEATSNNNEEEREELEQIDVDFDETPFVNFYPTTLIRGTFPEDEGNPVIRFPNESNNDHRHQGYIGLVVDDLTVDTTDESGFDMSEAAFLKTGENDSAEYRAVNFNDDQTSEAFGGDGVDISGDKYEVEDRVTEIDGRSILVVNRSASRSVAATIDVNGATPADMDESTGEPNDGLIEYPSDDADTDLQWRYARRPELREDLYGEEVGVLVTRRSEVDEDFAEDIEGDDSQYDMMWYTVVDGDGESVEPTTGDATGYSFLEWNFDPTAGHLPDEQWNFVQQYIKNDLSDDEDTILKNIEENFDDANEDRIVGLIQNEVTAE